MPGYQPYRKGKARPAGMTFAAMIMGKPRFMPNPMDARRKLQKRGSNRRTHNARR